MKKMPVSVAKAKLLATVDKVCATGEAVILTKRGKPVAVIGPYQRDPDSIFGFMAGEMRIVGDIESPVVPLKDWKVLR